MKPEPVIIENILNAHLNQVWKAISNHVEMEKWYFDLPGFVPEVGCEFTFYGGTEERQYLHLCKVTEVIPFSKISYSWRYEGYPGNSMVTFELFEDGNKTRIKLIHSGLETFPEDIPDFDRKNFVAGWTEIINISLVGYLGVQ